MGQSPLNSLSKEVLKVLFQGNHSRRTRFLLFLTKNLDCALYNCISQYGAERQTLVVAPVYRGQKEARERAIKDFVSKDARNKGNIYVLVKEVER